MDLEKVITEFQRLEEIIDNRAEQIFKKYRDYFMHRDEQYCEIELDSKTFSIKWNVYWSYGGYDSGYIEIPKNDFCGDWEKWLQDQIQIDIDKKAAADKKIKINKIKREKAQLKKLKEKYE